MLFKKLIASAILIAACTAPAHATTISFGGGSSPTDGVDGNVLSFSNGGVSVQASGWTLTGDTLETSWLGRYSNGLGVTNDAETGWSLFNQYGADNVNGVDIILLIFNQAVSLQSAVLTPIQTGWLGRDNDATVSYANLPGTTSLSVNSPAWLTLASAAYGVSGNTSSPFMTVLNSTQNYGNIWVVAAATPSPDYLSDGFYLSSVTVKTAAVPEPSTWAAMIIGMGGVGAALRKRRRKTGLSQIA